MDRNDLELLAKGLGMIARRQDLADCIALLALADLPAGLPVTVTGIVLDTVEMVAVSLLDLREWLGHVEEVAA